MYSKTNALRAKKIIFIIISILIFTGCSKETNLPQTQTEDNVQYYCEQDSDCASFCEEDCANYEWQKENRPPNECIYKFNCSCINNKCANNDDGSPSDQITDYSNMLDEDDDGDGLTNREEGIYGTNPKDKDTDKDGYTDYDEIKNGYDPLTAGGDSAKAEEKPQANIAVFFEAGDCEKIKNLSIQDKCYLQIATENNDISYCDKIASDLSTKNECYKSLAINTNDKETCDKIENINTKYSCLITIDPETSCDYIVDQAEQDSCLLNIAIQTEDEELCKKTKFNLAYTESSCLEKIATIKKDPEICEKIEVESRYDVCLQSVATATLDKSLCEKINRETMKPFCVNAVALQTGYVSQDEKDCEQFSGEDNEYCFWSMGTTNFNESLCEKAGEKKDTCLDIINNR